MEPIRAGIFIPTSTRGRRREQGRLGGREGVGGGREEEEE
jgi:hypothetical protein